MHASDNLILITLLVKLGVAAAVASSLARSTGFKRLLLRGAERTRAETMRLMAWICVPLTLGVLVRVRVPNFLAADLSFEATTLLALLFGPTAAFAGGALLALPALLHREYFALAVNLSVAAIFSAFREFVDEEDVWSFSPLIDLSIYRWVRRTVKWPHLDRQIFLLVLIMAVQFAASQISKVYSLRYFELYSRPLGD